MSAYEIVPNHSRLVTPSVHTSGADGDNENGDTNGIDNVSDGTIVREKSPYGYGI